MDTKEIVDYWVRLSNDKWETAKGLMKIKRYADALFFCHLSLEALLKGCIVLKTKKPAPYVHNLAELADLAKLEVDDEQFKQLKEITTFNIKGRYDNHKYSFYKKATKSYAEEYFEITKKTRLWVKKNIQLKK